MKEWHKQKIKQVIKYSLPLPFLGIIVWVFFTAPWEFKQTIIFVTSLILFAFGVAWIIGDKITN